ncbi:MAG: NAD(P)/FAD-dependent oxidoreductase [Ardenticatenaceae bacterium]|nr:NAD(P)/FAD-dependent oxidoreductase [Ardenticatenaceae bacterium]
MTTNYLIIGNGAAGATAAETIRQRDGQGRITIVSPEPYPMYSRPGLAYVATGEIPPQQVLARTAEWYTQQQIERVLGEAVQLDVAGKRVGLGDGRFLPYDRLLIATGARAVPPPYPGGELDGVVYLDTLDGTKHLLQKARRARRAVVIGGGITALEMVEGLAAQGVETHYLVRGDSLWGKVFNEAESRLVEEKMHHHGVIIHYRTEVSEILGNWRGKVRAVRLKSGEELKCDLFGVAIGVKPHLNWLKGSPISMERAILVDEFLQTNVPDVYAAGDCAQVWDRWTEQYLQDVLWPSAVAQGRAAGLNMVSQVARPGGRPQQDQRTPYQKGTPFNVCLLFGLHITVIGQINPSREAEDEFAEVQAMSRGSSQVWFTFPRHYSSAWSAQGANTLRLVLAGDRLVGALIVGEQSTADALRALIEHEVNVAVLRPFLQAESEVLKREIMKMWETGDWRLETCQSPISSL